LDAGAPEFEGAPPAFGKFVAGRRCGWPAAEPGIVEFSIGSGTGVPMLMPFCGGEYCGWGWP
jgi:hypothetical protein